MGIYRLRSWRSRDYQRRQVYDWQYSLGIDEDNCLKAPEITRLIAEACEVYGLSEDEYPRWRFNSRLKVHSRYLPYENTIELARGWGSSALVVIHEVVHAIQYKLNIRDCWHGPVFVGLYKDLMEMFLDPKTDPLELALRRGLDVIESPERLSSSVAHSKLMKD